MEKPISVKLMAKKLLFSRSHFYALIKKQIFPRPSMVNGRPMYLPDGQKACLEIRRTGVAASGAYVYFNEKLSKGTAKKPTKKFDSLIESLQGLGLEANASQIEAAVKDLYPNEKPDLESPNVIKAVFLRLRS